MITQITIKGKEHPFCYGFGALMAAEELLGGKIDATSKATLIMMWACLFNGDNDFPYDPMALGRLIDTEDGLFHQLNSAMTVQLERWGKPSLDDCDKKKD